jgi:hypothetical protein
MASVFDQEVKAYTLREMARRTRTLSGDGLPLYTESALRAFTRRKSNPLPCIRRGGKRPHVYVFEPVVRAFIAFEMGVAQYAEVEQAARLVLDGARS